MPKRGFASAGARQFVGICSLLVVEVCSGQEEIRNARSISASQALDRDFMNDWAGKGIAFPVTLTTEVLGNVSGGTKRKVIWESLLIAGLEVDFEKAAGLKGLSLALSGLYPQGSGLTDKAVHDFNTLSNIDGYDSLRLYEAWLQQEFWEGKFSIRLGQILADAEFFGSENGALFINSSFGAIPLVSQNLVPPIFPVAAPGLRLRTAPTTSCYAEVALFSGNVGDPATNNKHNTRLSFRGQDGVLVFAEVGYSLNPREVMSDKATTDNDSLQTGKRQVAPAATGLSGTYKVGGYYDSGRFDDSDGDGSTHRGNFSIYFITDQELWRSEENPNRVLSFFTRIGMTPADRNTVPFYFDTGLDYRGFLAGRDKDRLGLGFSYARIKHGPVGDTGDEIPTNHEAVIELTYQLALGEHVSLQPDFQYIIYPGAIKDAPTAVVTGLRLNIRF